MAREKNVRLSEVELEKLKQYRDSEYDSSIPLGFVIGELVDNA
jgi:hypothetical protein